MRNVACKKCPLSTQSGHRWLKSPSEPIGLVINAPTAYRDAVQEPTLEQLVGEAPLSDCRRTPLAEGTPIGVWRPSLGTVDSVSGVCCWFTAEPAHSLAAAARSEENTSELQSLMSISYVVF